MTQADRYRVKATELAGKAKSAPSHELQVEFAMMAAAYLRLAKQAERSPQPRSVRTPQGATPRAAAEDDARCGDDLW